LRIGFELQSLVASLLIKDGQGWNGARNDAPDSMETHFVFIKRQILCMGIGLLGSISFRANAQTIAQKWTFVNGKNAK